MIFPRQIATIRGKFEPDSGLLSFAQSGVQTIFEDSLMTTPSVSFVQISAESQESAKKRNFNS
jgi:hypothetical protein